MELKTLHVERRISGRLDLQLQLSTNPTELQESSRLLQHGAPAPILEAIFLQATQYVSRLRTNLNIGNLALHDLPEKVRFRDCLKPYITDSDVGEAPSRVLRLAKPSSAFIRKVLRAVYGHFEPQEGGGSFEGSHVRIATEADAEG
jgi:hypothetical protein